jgi:single-strand DNA-binding protein
MVNGALEQGLNRVTLVGRLGRAPEMRYTPTGKPVTSFSIVTTYTWMSSNYEVQEETDWFDVVAWGNLAEECKQSLAKGQRVYVEGRIKTRRWGDEDSVPHSRAEVVAQGVISLNS